MTCEILVGDCLREMQRLETASVDLVLVDLPYGVTQNKWDEVIPFAPLWAQYLRIAKQNAALVFTAAQPFTSALVMSQPSLFRYDWVWKKPKGTGHLNAKKQPLRDKEDILVFYRDQPTYNPQMTVGDPYPAKGGKNKGTTYGTYTQERNENFGERYPRQILEFGGVERNRNHPSEKPVDLLRYLIRTYTNPGEVVFDNTMGSGSTGVAALREGRRFVGIEQDEGYYETAQKRLTAEPNEQPLDELIRWALAA